MNKGKLIQVIIISIAILLQNPFLHFVGIFNCPSKLEFLQYHIVAGMILIGMIHIQMLILTYFYKILNYNITFNALKFFKEYFVRKVSNHRSVLKERKSFIGRISNINMIRVMLVVPCIFFKHVVNEMLGVPPCLRSMTAFQRLSFEVVTLFGLIYIVGIIAFSIIKLFCPDVFLRLKQVIYTR